MFVKICGIRTAEDARACVEAGADAVGFNLWPGSKRHVTVEEAAAIGRTLPPGLRRFGVFVNAAPDEIARAFEAGAIDTAQLHGDETREFCARLGRPLMKALRLKDAGSLEGLEAWPGPLVLVDADSSGYGGSGLRIDEALAARAARVRPILLAGGLTPENVAGAIRAVRPFGVDVASGVEAAPGQKDAARVAAFVRAARAALRGTP